MTRPKLTSPDFEAWRRAEHEKTAAYWQAMHEQALRAARERRRREARIDSMLMLLVFVLLALLVASAIYSSVASAATVTRAEWRVSTYGWPGDDPYQRLAGCGYKKVGGLDAGRPMPCRLTPTLPIVAHRTLPLGILVRVCYTRRVSDLVLVRRCAGARVGDRCGPGCDRNGVDADLSWGLARRIAFPYSIANVTVLRVVPR